MSPEPFNSKFDKEDDRPIDWRDIGKQIAIAALIIGAAVALLVVAL